MRSYRPNIFVILESRISGEEADEACSKLGKTDWARSDAVGFSGGVWVLWSKSEISLRIITLVSFSFMHLYI